MLTIEKHLCVPMIRWQARAMKFRGGFWVLAGTILGTIVGQRRSRKSKPVVYLGFSPR